MMIENSLNFKERMDILGMEFIRQTDGNYIIKNSNGYIVSEKEKLQLENRELILEDIKSDKCVEKTTKQISANNKRIKEIDENIKKTKSAKK